MPISGTLAANLKNNRTNHSEHIKPNAICNFFQQESLTQQILMVIYVYRSQNGRKSIFFDEFETASKV